MATPNKPADVEVELATGGGVWVITPLTPLGEEWLKTSVKLEEWQRVHRACRHRDGYAVDHRFIGALVENAAADGLHVRVL